MKNMPNKSLDPEDCPIRQVLDRLGDKWSILIIELLGHQGKLRFSEMSQQISDISQKMLTVTLRSLEADGLISRKFFAQIPPRVEYELTALGRSLLPHIEDLTTWALTNRETILDHRKNYARKKEASGPAKTSA